MSETGPDPLGSGGLKPWQWGAIASVLALTFFLAPPAYQLYSRQFHKPPPEQAVSAPVGGGTPYKPPHVDDAGVQVVTARSVAPAQAQVPATGGGLLNTKSQEEQRREAEVSWPNQRRQQRERAPERTAEAQALAPDAATDPLAMALKPTKLEGVRAARDMHPEFTIPAGTKIPCNLTTALDTSAPGFITANIPIEVRGADPRGTVVLIDRGSTLLGEVQRGVANGIDRSFVLWHSLRTPDGVEVALDSPATDEIGANGLDVELNQHIWRKLRSAVMITALNGAFSTAQAALQQGSRGNNNYFFGGNIGSSAESAASRILEHDLQIPDTGTRPQGSACMVLVARRVDFSSVYALRHVRQQ